MHCNSVYIKQMETQLLNQAGSSSTHTNTQEPASGGKFKCEDCEATFPKQNKLKRHVQNVHQDARPFKCPDCGQDYKRKEHLTRHVSSVHAGDVARSTFPCPYQESAGCLQTFPNRDQQRKHVARTHERRLTCDICNQAEVKEVIEGEQGGITYFQKKSQLRKHMSEIHGEGYACGHCGRHFSKRKHLNSHIARIRKSMKKRSTHIFFEHEINMLEEGVGGEMSGSELSSSDSEEEGVREEQGLVVKRGEMEEQKDDGGSGLLQLTQQNKRPKLNPEVIEQRIEVKLEDPVTDLVDQCLKPARGRSQVKQPSSRSNHSSSYALNSRSISSNRSGHSISLSLVEGTQSFQTEGSLFAKRYLLQCNSCGMFQGLHQKSSDFMKHITRCWAKKEKSQLPKSEEVPKLSSDL
ncbi:hypothetical protein FGO68_gene1124 [Halteria grandinella]|uniref:C2H2-type domain-containing protein n=1 Tax=Halteria grandinella TaxID=5974 RepID=A0A8J8NPZ6_HALGN|nr:hypothetical protein FGO68_gene1124 [Halteria grandinella]